MARRWPGNFEAESHRLPYQRLARSSQPKQVWWSVGHLPDSLAAGSLAVLGRFAPRRACKPGCQVRMTRPEHSRPIRGCSYVGCCELDSGGGCFSR
jgi:hypothetical protein